MYEAQRLIRICYINHIVICVCNSWKCWYEYPLPYIRLGTMCLHTITVLTIGGSSLLSWPLLLSDKEGYGALMTTTTTFTTTPFIVFSVKYTLFAKGLD